MYPGNKLMQGYAINGERRMGHLKKIRGLHSGLGWLTWGERGD